MRKEDEIVKPVVFSSKTNVGALHEYEPMQIMVVKLKCSDVLTTSVDFEDANDNIGEFKDVWGE